MNATTTTAMIPTSPVGFEPNKRVNFLAGMVLRASDFIQSQDYSLSKLNQHNLIEHGYGVVRGLIVDVDTQSAGGELKIVVKPGLGVDRLGRVFELSKELCADLRAWLDKNNGWPSSESSGTSTKIDQTVYVVASYAEYLTDEVAIADAPCANTTTRPARSRITDSLKLELTKTKPVMDMWATTLALRAWMNRIVVVEGRYDDEADVAKLYEAIAKLSPSPAMPDQNTLFRIHTSNMQTVLGELERIWVTAVVPAVAERDRSGAPEILLATIDYVVDVAQSPARLEQPEVDLVSRPSLLQTQVFQGLPMARQASIEASRRLINFVTVTPQPASGKTQAVELWFHLDARVSGVQTTFGDKAPELKVWAELADGTLKAVESTELTGKPKNNVYTVTLTPEAKTPTGHLRFEFDLTGVTVIDPQAPTPPTPAPGKKGKAEAEGELPIMTYLASEGLVLEGYAPGSVVIFVRNTSATATTTTPGKRS